MQEYVRGRPHPALAAHVVAYTGYREHSVAPLRRRQAPTGSCTLILGYGGAIQLDGPSGTSVPMAFLAGMHDAPVITQFVGGQCGVQVDLTPLGVFELLGRPMYEITNQVVPLDDLGARDLAALPGRLAEDPNWPARFARVDAVLRRRLELSPRRPNPEVTWAWGRLAGSAGAIEVSELAARTGWSRRHLLTRFREQIGLAPKTAARVLRFRRAAQLLVPSDPSGAPPTNGAIRNQAGSLADIAATCGYADHSHLVRDFHTLAGCTPSRYFEEWGGG